jgi:hypothetical protein
MTTAQAPELSTYRWPSQDNIPVADKKPPWIHGTTRRWDGYLEFQRRPGPMLKWFAKHMQ